MNTSATGLRRAAWRLTEVGRPLEITEDTLRAPGPGEAVIAIAGCGFCHTDLSFIEGEVKPRASLPIVLGHEIAGKVVAAGADATAWVGASVVAAAVIPCGACSLCRIGRGNICQHQVMPGSDCDGGFASHVILPARGLHRVGQLAAGLQLADVSVVADAVSTALQAVERARVSADDLVIVIGAGGVGGFTAQIAALAGAHVIAVDIDDARLESLAAHGARDSINSRGLEPRALRAEVRARARAAGVPEIGWKIFECSGTVAGQESAFVLLTTAATLMVVGYTRQPGTFRLSNLMAFDAELIGTWGCPPELYPRAIQLVCDGQIAVKPFSQQHPMDELPGVIAAAANHTLTRRAILVNQ